MLEEMSLREASCLGHFVLDVERLSFSAEKLFYPELFWCIVFASILGGRGHLKCSQLKIDIME